MEHTLSTKKAIKEVLIGEFGEETGELQVPQHILIDSSICSFLSGQLLALHIVGYRSATSQLFTTAKL